MKYKNYKSAIHNFSHSFISIDYMKSGRLAVNILIDLYNLGKETKASIDFINKTINPIEAESIESKQLLNDYLSWLPEHFEKHNCDLSQIEKLEITIMTDFKNTIPNESKKRTNTFQISALTKWKAEGRDEQILEICQNELIEQKLLRLEKLPRMIEF